MDRLSGSDWRERLENTLGVCELCGRPAGTRERHLEEVEVLCPTCASEARAWMLEEDEPSERIRSADAWM